MQLLFVSFLVLDALDGDSVPTAKLVRSGSTAKIGEPLFIACGIDLKLHNALPLKQRRCWVEWVATPPPMHDLANSRPTEDPPLPIGTDRQSDRSQER